MSAPDQTFTIAERPHEYSWAIGDGRLNLHRHGPVSGSYYWTGTFIDRRGIARIYREATHTSIDIAWGSRCYSRSWRRHLGDRTIARLARAMFTDLEAGAMTR